MRAPCTDYLVGPRDRGQDRRVIVRPNRIGGTAHLARVGGAIGKDVEHAKRPEPQRARATFTAFDRWVVLHLGRGRGVEHHEKRPAPIGVPNAGQRIAIGFAIGIRSNRVCIALDMVAGDHGAVMPSNQPKENRKLTG